MGSAVRCDRLKAMGTQNAAMKADLKSISGSFEIRFQSHVNLAAVSMLAGEVQLLDPTPPTEADGSRNHVAKGRRNAGISFGLESDLNGHLRSWLGFPINDDSSWDFAGKALGARLLHRPF